MSVEPSWRLLIALVLLIALAVGASTWGRFGQGKATVFAALRAIVQLGVVSLVIVACLQNMWLALLFTLLMYGIGVRTTTQRTGVGQAWPWTALAMISGVLPVLGIIFATGVAPFNGYSVIPLAGIVVGNMMTAHTLFGRRQFAALRENIPTYEAALSIGLDRSSSIKLVTEATAKEALVPNLDQTRTVGLVTLPGAFIGVLLGGGTALQAGAAQVLVLIGIMAGQNVTVAVANRLMCQARLLPADLKERLRP